MFKQILVGIAILPGNRKSIEIAIAYRPKNPRHGTNGLLLAFLVAFLDMCGIRTSPPPKKCWLHLRCYQNPMVVGDP
jgi:hypothetical protein